MKILRLVGKIFFLFCTIIVTITYSIALKVKIEKPNFKNLNTTEFIVFGIILLSLIFINIKIVTTYFKKSKI
jgi:hypothetical protein